MPACLAAAARERNDVVWSGSLPDCGDCASPPAKRSWLAKLTHRQPKEPTVSTLEHYTPEFGRQGIGVEFFRLQYLQ